VKLRGSDAFKEREGQHTDRGICTLTWRRQLPLERPDEQGRVVVAMEQPGQTFAWGDVAPLLADAVKVDPATLVPPRPPPSDRTSAELRLRPQAMTLPFSNIESPTAQMVVPASARDAAALPFVAAGPAPVPAPVSARTLPEPDSAVFPVAAPPLPVAPPPVAPPAPAFVAPVALPVEPAAEAAWTAGQALAAGAAPKVAAPTFLSKTGGATIAAVAAAPEPWTPPARVEARTEAADILELLWYEPDSVPRIRRTKAYKPILAALEQQPVDRDLDDPALAAEPMELEDRREVFEILAHGTSVEAEGIDRALDAAVRADGKFVSQLALLAAELEFHFDELETLKATVATVAPFVTPEAESLKNAVESAKEFLKTADELTPPSVAEGMTTRIRTAFADSKRGVPDTHLVEQTDRVLLSQRRYQKRIVFGALHLRSLVHLPGSSTPVPAYLPESLAKKLPMFQRFRARFIAEVHQQADQYETHHASLRVIALARATARRRDY
jgi:hypothetical protein